MSTPSQIPVTQIATYDNVRTVDCIVDESENGYFYNSALLIDQVLRDARVFATLMTRILGLLGKPLEFEAAKDTARGRKMAEEAESDWPKMFPDAVLVDLITWGLMQGIGLGRIVQDQDPWTLEVWHPWAVRWDKQLRSYFVQVMKDGAPVERRIIPDGGGCYTDDDGTMWVLFTPFGYGNAGRRGLLRNLHHLYLERQWSHRDRSRYSEIFGQPLRFGIAPLGSTKDDRDSFKRKLLPQGAEAVVVASQGVEGNRWDLKLVEAAGKSTELFQVEIEQLDKEIATLILGQSQSTDGQGGLGNQEKAGESVRLDVMRFDDEALSTTLRAQFLVPYYEFAYGSGDMAPWPCRDIEPPEDTKSRAEEFLALMQGVQIAKTNAVPLDVRALLDRHDLPMISEEEEAAMKAEAAAAAKAALVVKPDNSTPKNGEHKALPPVA